LIIWGVWVAGNSIIFKGVPLALEITMTKSIIIMSSLPLKIRESFLDSLRRSRSTNLLLGFFSMGLHNIIVVEEDDFSIFQILIITL
jgi:hypothetical protein